MKKIYLLLCFLPLLAFGLHKYYISFTKINFIKESKSIQITTRMFIDDLENALNAEFKIHSKLHTEKEISGADEYISKYISNKFFVLIDNKKRPYNFIGKEYEDDEIVVYLEIEDIPAVSSIEIKNNALMELFEDQQNIIKLNINGKKKSFILTRKSDKDLLKF